MEGLLGVGLYAAASSRRKRTQHADAPGHWGTSQVAQEALYIALAAAASRLLVSRGGGVAKSTCKAALRLVGGLALRWVVA